MQPIINSFHSGAFIFNIVEYGTEGISSSSACEEQNQSLWEYNRVNFNHFSNLFEAWKGRMDDFSDELNFDLDH